MEIRMNSRFMSFVWPLALAASLMSLSACAGSKSSSNSSAGSAESQKNQKLDEARHSAEEAEFKAHQLREEKNRSQSKTSSN